MLIDVLYPKFPMLFPADDYIGTLELARVVAPKLPPI
jgi:hypothetical protein